MASWGILLVVTLALQTGLPVRAEKAPQPATPFAVASGPTATPAAQAWRPAERAQAPSASATMTVRALSPSVSPPRPGFICTPGRIWRRWESCLDHGPGTTAYRIAHISLPDPLPELSLVELTVDPDEDVVPYTYAYVHTLPLSIYAHPMEATLGLPPVRILYSGDQWVSVEAAVEFEGERWIQINKGEFVRAEALALARPSRFQGIYLAEQPPYPFAWINRSVRPSRSPHGPPDPDAPLYRRYQTVSIYAQEYWGTEEIWYLIGPDQWVEQSNVSKVTVDPPPARVGSGERWVEIDLFEQTLAAYEGERLVYATLISSGRPGSTWTESGLFQIWAKLPATKMSTPDSEDGRSDWYHLEDVPWTMYFNGATALHAAYWHDAFGFTRSHGCVNLAPRDAEWLFGWTSPYVTPGSRGIYSTGTWVWVHNTSPFNR
ncbi:MAG: L,D-transpeptidase [Anaerolineae bacterium]